MRGEQPGEWAAQLLARVPGFDAQGHPVADPDTGSEQVQVDRFALIEGIDNLVLFDAAAGAKYSSNSSPRRAVGRQQACRQSGERHQDDSAIASADDRARSPLPSAMRRKPSRGLLWCCSGKRNGPTWWPGRSGWTRDPLTPRRPCPAPHLQAPATPDADRDPACRRGTNRPGNPPRFRIFQNWPTRRSSWVKQPSTRRSRSTRPPPRRRRRNHPQTGCAHRHGAAPGTGRRPSTPRPSTRVRQPRPSPRTARPAAPTMRDAAVLIERPSRGRGGPPPRGIRMSETHRHRPLDRPVAPRPHATRRALALGRAVLVAAGPRPTTGPPCGPGVSSPHASRSSSIPNPP